MARLTSGLLLLCLPMLAACQNDETIKDAGDEDADDGGSDDGGSGDGGSGDGGSGDGGSGDGDSGDGGAGDGWEPYYMTMYATAGIDMETRTLHTFVVDGEAIQPYVRIIVLDEEQDQSCSVFFVMEEPTAVAVEDWVYEDATEAAEGQQMHQIGFMVPDDAAIYLSDGCETVDESLYGPIADLMVPLQWGVGFGDMRVDVQANVESMDSSSWAKERYDEGQLFGASWSSNLWEPTTWASHVSLISPAPTFVLEVDEDGVPTEFFDQSEVDFAGGDVPSGVYQQFALSVWRMESFFEAR